MKEIWELLKIEPTKDKKEIRRAFAAQSRLHHPEEEPEYFEKLNEAYRLALGRIREGAEREGAGGYGGREQTEEGGGYKERGRQEGAGGRGERGQTEEAGRCRGDGQAEEAGGPSGEGQKASLLGRLAEAEAQEVRESMQEGALREFILLFENPKQAKQAEAWKRFFMSDAFLEEQFSERFGKGLLAFLTGQTQFSSDNLPAGLLQELAIAYGLIPHFAGEEYFEGLKYPKQWYKVSVENTFPARRHVAEIFNMQGRECDLKSITGRILRQPANKVRYNAFADYFRLKEMGREGRLTDKERETWQHILGMAQVCYLYERNGKKPGSGDYESRSECVVKLYVRWLKDESLPEEVLKFIYKKFAFRELARSSTRGLYGAWKEQVLKQLPEVEEELFAEDGKEQRITRLYRVCSKIISDNHANYDQSVYEETPEIKERVREFFAMPEWERLRNDKGLFERICSAAKRIVMPASMTKELIRYLEDGDFPEPERTELMEYLLRSLSTGRLCREQDCRHEVSFSETELSDIGGSPDFWQYYLMRGFGYRHGKLRGDWEDGMVYELDGECYLPAYIQYMYAPSKVWQRRFVGFEEETETIADPVSAQCVLPDGRRLRVEFHYHYCLYFVDEEPVHEPFLPFGELLRHAGRLEKAEEFFFLLAVTVIEEERRTEAKALIERWLEQVPVYPFIRPVIAGMLAAGDAGCAGAEAVWYYETERFCFRAVVREAGVKVFRQVDFGWGDWLYRRKEFGWKELSRAPELWRREEAARAGSLEERRAAGKLALRMLAQPKPVRRESVFLEGMDAAEKTAAILRIMGCPEDPEGSCVLRYGKNREKRHDRIFYGARLPFGFELWEQSPEYQQSMNYLISVSNRKIKEKKELIWRFGWGYKYSLQSDYGPMCVYLGESGTYYAMGSVRMHRGESLAELLADFFAEEFEGAAEAVSYEGPLSVSRLDHRLEYGYTEQDVLHSIYMEEDTKADLFAMFGRHRLWTEFARWMDDILKKGLPEWVARIRIGLDLERRGALTFAGYAKERETEFGGLFGEAPDGEEALEEETADIPEPYLPETPLFIWGRGQDPRVMGNALSEALEWYADSHKALLEKCGVSILK